MADICILVTDGPQNKSISNSLLERPLFLRERFNFLGFIGIFFLLKISIQIDIKFLIYKFEIINLTFFELMGKYLFILIQRF